MASSYLKALQITKQLEQKAKEATKYRQQAEDGIETVENAIKAAKKLDVNVAKAEAALQAGQEALKDKDYEKAVAKIDKANDEIRKSREEFFDRIMQSSELLLEMTRGMDAVSDESESLLDEARKALKDGDLEKAVEKSKRSYEISERVLHEKVSETFTTAQSMVVLAKDMDRDVTKAEEFLNKARTAIETSDFETALKNIGGSLEETGSVLEHHILKTIEEAKELVSIGSKMEADILEGKTLLRGAERATEEMDYEKALDKGTKALADLHRTIKSQLDRFISTSKKLMSQARENGADVDESGRIISKAESAMEANRYERTLDLINEAIEYTENAQFQTVLKIISHSRNKFITAKNIGVDLSKAMEYLDKARTALRDSEFTKAIEMAKNGESELQKAIQDYETASQGIESVQAAFNEAQELGADTSQSKELLDKARAMLENQDFSSALDLVTQTRELTEKAEYDHVLESIEQAEYLMTMGEESGLDVSEANDLLDQSISSMKSKSYQEAIEFSTKCQYITGELLAESIKTITESLTKRIEEAEKTGQEIGDSKGLLEKAVEALRLKDYTNSRKLAEQSREHLEAAQSQIAQDTLDDAKRMLDLMADMGQDVANIGALIKQADNAMREEKYEKSLELSRLARTELVKLQMNTANDTFNNAKAVIIEVKKVGIDISGFREPLFKAKEELDKGNYEAAFEIASKQREEAEKLMDLREKSIKALSHAAGMLTNARKDNIDVAPVKKIVLEAKAMFQSAKFEDTIEKVQEAQVELEKLTAQYSAAKKILMANEKLKEGKELELDIDSAESLLKQAKEKIKDKDYPLALENANKAIQEIDELIRTNSEADIEKARTMITEAKKVGVDVLVLEKLIEKAKSFYDREEFARASQYAVRSQKEIEELKDHCQLSARTIQMAQAKIAEVESIQADTTQAKTHLDEAMKILRANDYIHAIEEAKKSIQAAQDSRHAYVASTIESFREMVANRKKENVETTEADELLNRADAALAAEKYTDALQLAMQSESEMERKELQLNMAQNALKIATENLALVKKDGIGVKAAEAMLKKAETALKQGDYPDALEKAVQCSDLVNEANEKSQECKNMLEAARARITEVFKSGADIDQAKDIFEKAKALMEGQNYDSAVELAKESMNKAKTSYRSHILTLFDGLEELIPTAQAVGVDITHTQTEVKTGREYVTEEMFTEAKELLDTAAKELRTSIQERVNSRLKAFADMIKTLKAKGADTKKLQLSIGEVRKAMKKDDYMALGKLIQATAAEVKNLAQQASKFKGRADDIGGKILSAKKFGINLSEAENIFEKAKIEAEKNETKAVGMLKSVEAEIEKSIDNFSPRLEVKMGSGEGLEIGRETQIELSLKNSGKSVAKNVSITFDGPFEIACETEVNVIPGGGERPIPLGVKPGESGEVKLKVKTEFTRLFDGKELSTTQTLTLKVNKATPDYQKMKAAEATKCQVCKGAIKTDMNMIRCRCGKDFHEACATRAAVCPDCGTSLKPKTVKKRVALKI